AIRSITLLAGHREPPLWLIDNPPFPADSVLPTRNALVYLPWFVDGNPKAIAKPSPAFFCTFALEYAFNPHAPDPTCFFDFLDSIWPNDQQSKDTLQEWIGYLLTPDTSQQTIAFLLGPPRSGRGTIARVIGSLIGKANVAGPTLSSLATSF